MHTAEFKAQIIVEGFTRKNTVQELCSNHQITISSYYDWRKRFVSAGTNGLRRKVTPRSIKPKLGPDIPTQAAILEEIKAKFEASQRQHSPLPYRMPASVKMKVIELVEASGVSKRASLTNMGLARTTYYNWVHRLQEAGTLQPCLRSPEYRHIAQREDLKEQVFQVMHAPPLDFGFNRTTWKLVDLQDALKRSGCSIGRHSIRQIVKDAGYKWAKARKVLTSNDPSYSEKLAEIQDILAGLGKSERFFSIDEYGPFAVKQRQGKKLVPPGTAYTVPQFQKSKGVLIMTAALELSSNQVTHFYSKKKNTEEMIKLLDILLREYRHLDCIYLSWDAASWHMSKKLLEKIENENTISQTLGGPKVKLAPLPAGAQFLNVIEAIFSGMSRAIIHNSNYSSVEEAKTAIDRYFLERNQFFRENPRRAGRKIWGEERVAVRFADSNNCKDPRYR